MINTGQALHIARIAYFVSMASLLLIFAGTLLYRTPHPPLRACRALTPEAVETALGRLKQRIPGASIVGAVASEICGLVKVQFANGAVAYTDPGGNYLLRALSLDAQSGSPADVVDAVGQAVEARATNETAGGQALRMSIPTQPFKD